jgi:hypothetical protein
MRIEFQLGETIDLIGRRGFVDEGPVAVDE